MDTADGCYGQLADHFGEKQALESVLRQTKVVFITHMHGDHQLGILKLMHERDKIMANTEKSKRSSLFVVVPTPIIEWLKLFIKDSL